MLNSLIPKFIWCYNNMPTQSFQNTETKDKEQTMDTDIQQSKDFLQVIHPFTESPPSSSNSSVFSILSTLSSVLEKKVTFTDQIEHIPDEESWENISQVEMTDDYDLMSDLQSVQSFDSFQFSYKDMVQMRKESPTPAEQKIIQRHKDLLSLESDQRKTSSAGTEDDTEHEYLEDVSSTVQWDEQAFVNGYKLGRGGKAKFMFNTNQRNLNQKRHPKNVYQQKKDSKRRNRRALKARTRLLKI